MPYIMVKQPGSMRFASIEMSLLAIVALWVAPLLKSYLHDIPLIP